MGLNTKVKSKGHILNMSSFFFLSKHFIEILYCVLLVCYLALQGLSRVTYKQKGPARTKQIVSVSFVYHLAYSM